MSVHIGSSTSSRTRPPTTTVVPSVINSPNELARAIGDRLLEGQDLDALVAACPPADWKIARTWFHGRLAADQIAPVREHRSFRLDATSDTYVYLEKRDYEAQVTWARRYDVVGDWFMTQGGDAIAKVSKKKGNCRLATALEELDEGQDYPAATRTAHRTLRSHEIVWASEHLGLLRTVAAQYANGTNFGDACQAGLQGLYDAARRFDVTRGFRFATYAWPWVQRAMLRYFNTETLVAMPAVYQTRMRQIEKAETGLHAEGLPVTNEAIAAMPGVRGSLKIVEEQRSHRSFKMVPLDKPKEEGGRPQSDLLEGSPAEPEYAHQLRRGRLGADLATALNTLTEREAEILLLRYGLGEEPAMTLKAIGVLLGVTRERIRQIEARAIAKIQDNIPVMTQLARRLLEMPRD